MNDPFIRAVAHFNAEEYREALLAFEERWAIERGDFLRGLIQLCNALNQLRLGLITSPRQLLASADTLLAPYTPRHEGLDIDSLRASIAVVRALIPGDVETGSGSVAWECVPRLRLEFADR
jgi:predicted metal-dependent hydrolase